MYSFPNLEPVCCSMFDSNCCFLTCIQVSQKPGKVVWYSHLFKNFPQFVLIHIVKVFSVVNEAEVDGFWNFLPVSMTQWMLAIWSLVPLPFLNLACTFGSSVVEQILNGQWTVGGSFPAIGDGIIDKQERLEWNLQCCIIVRDTTINLCLA